MSMDCWATGLGFAGNEGLEKKMETTIMLLYLGIGFRV